MKEKLIGVTWVIILNSGKTEIKNFMVNKLKEKEYRMAKKWSNKSFGREVSKKYKREKIGSRDMHNRAC